MEKLTAQETGSGYYRLYYHHKYIGYTVMGDDGYHLFVCPTPSGYWDSNSLSMVAEALDELNKPWDDHVKANLK